MHKLDRVGALVIIIIASFALYLALANLLTFLWSPLPLGSIGNDASLIATVFVLVSIAFLNLRRQQKQQANPTKSV